MKYSTYHARIGKKKKIIYVFPLSQKMKKKYS